MKSDHLHGFKDMSAHFNCLKRFKKRNIAQESWNGNSCLGKKLSFHLALFQNTL